MYFKIIIVYFALGEKKRLKLIISLALHFVSALDKNKNLKGKIMFLKLFLKVHLL